MNATMELTNEEIRKRLEQANEMAEIWDANESPIQMYLKGCIVTARALSGNDGKQPKKTG